MLPYNDVVTVSRGNFGRVRQIGLEEVSTRAWSRGHPKQPANTIRWGPICPLDATQTGQDLRGQTDTIREFIRRGVIVRTVINGLTFDGATKDPMQQAVRDSLIAFMAAMAQSQAEVTKEAQKAGIAHAVVNDDGSKYRGRKPTFTREQFTLVRELLGQGIPVSAIAKTAGLKRQSIYRIQAEPERQLAAIAAWYPNEAANQSHR
jgi:putative DNA-invertase from lambdoid prophage Rac